jgi:hypothetical protein
MSLHRSKTFFLSCLLIIHIFEYLNLSNDIINNNNNNYNI